MRLGLTWSDHDFYARLFGGVATALVQLERLGVRSLEFPQDRPFEAARLRSIMAAQDAGFRVTLHAPSEGAFSVAAFAEESVDEVRRNWETFLAEANALAARQGGDLVLATHGAAFASVDTPWRELARRSTTAFLVWLVEYTDDMGYGLRFGFENRPRVSGYTIAGDSHAEALAIVEEVEARAPGAARHLGTTWDMGHTAVNAYNRTEPTPTPDPFVRRAIHVHVHDTIGGDDHFPLVYGGYPRAEFLRRLAVAGYAGTINLELSPDRLGADGAAARRALETSIENTKRETEGLFGGEN